MATAFLIDEGGDCFGVLSFILFTFEFSGDDLFLFKFLPPLGVFGVFLDDRILGVGFLCKVILDIASLTGVTTGDNDLAFERAEAGVETIGVVNISESPVKLMSRELLLLVFFPTDFLCLTAVDFLTDLGDFPTDGDFCADFGVTFDATFGDFPFGDKDRALLGEDLVDACFAGTVFGVPILDFCVFEAPGVFFGDGVLEAFGVACFAGTVSGVPILDFCVFEAPGVCVFEAPGVFFGDGVLEAFGVGGADLLLAAVFFELLTGDLVLGEADDAFLAGVLTGLLL
jgi:hypothetical protein